MALSNPINMQKCPLLCRVTTAAVLRCKDIFFFTCKSALKHLALIHKGSMEEVEYERVHTVLLCKNDLLLGLQRARTKKENSHL